VWHYFTPWKSRLYSRPFEKNNLGTSWHLPIDDEELSMSMTKKFSGIALATTAALMFTTAPLMSAHADEAKVKCEGANACKGQGSCGGSKNSCAGKNACKGQGFTMTSKAECDAAKAKKSS
jgi:hypothetical protein